MFRSLRSKARRLAKEPSAALGFAAFLVLLAFLVGIVPFCCGVRWEAAEVWIAVLGVTAAVTAIYAAYLEIGILFPKQALKMMPVSYGYTSAGHGAPCILFINEKGSPVINAYLLELRLVDGIQHVGLDWSHAEDWEPTSDPNPRATHVWKYEGKAPLFPGTSIAGPIWAPRENATVVWEAWWYTDRGQSGHELFTFPPGYDSLDWHHSGPQ